MNDEYGDPETDVDAAILDDTLRELLNDISPAGPLPDADAIAQIREAIDVGWPGGSPPADRGVGHRSHRRRVRTVRPFR